MKNFTTEEREAMRSFLQRVEVRLSTMHRIGSAFLGGAGLLILFPIFFKEVITGLVNIFLSSDNGSLSPLILFAKFLLLIPFLLSLFIPLYALFLLLRDLVHFYFIGHSPGFPSTLFNPRFVLSGIAFSPDESEDVKREIMIYQYSSQLIHFILPFGEAQAAYYDNVINSTRDQIIPDERKIDHLINKKVIEKIYDEPEVVVKCKIPEKRSPIDIERFNAAFGLAGVKDRFLIEEVAKGEASLVRHATSLRRLVLRYMKALLMFILTTLISFFLISFSHLNDNWSLIVLGIGYLLWAIATPFLVKLPINWIYKNADPRAENVVQRDSQLVEFEKLVKNLSLVSLLCSVISLGFIIYSNIY